MNQSTLQGIKRFDGARTLLQVVRTAPMLSEKQKNYAELLPNPILPQVSIMWAFLESYLKKTADVFRVYPETLTILEQRVADLKDAFKLQAEGKTVDAEMAGTHHILVNYLVRYTLVNNALTQAQREELFYTLQKVKAQLSNAHGTTPAVIAVDKIDRYVVDLMFMLAESVTKAISDMSEKSWMECNTVLVAVLNVYRSRLSNLLEGAHVFINSAELGGATTPSFHAHAMSRRKDSGLHSLPEENRDDDTILTKKHFERLGPRQLSGDYIQETLEEIALENFLTLAEALPLQTGVMNNSQVAVSGTVAEEEEKALNRFLTAVSNLRTRILEKMPFPFDDFLTFFEADSLLSGLEQHSFLFSDEAPKKALSLRKRAQAFCVFMSNMRAKKRYWKRYADKVFISPVSEILAASLMRRIKAQGIEEKIKAMIREAVPEGMRIDFELADYFAFGDNRHVTPGFTFVAEPRVWSLYGRPVAEIAEESLNSHWEKIYYITEAYLRMVGDESAEEEILQKLDELIGISSVLQEMARGGIQFESTPSSLLYAGGDSGKEDITGTTKNYLRYFARCFAFAKKKKILLLPGLCPRTTVIELDEQDNVLKEKFHISPINVYMPVMKLTEFERRFGPFALLKEANARFELIGKGDDQFVIQKTGGECRTMGRPVFHRDKREHLQSHPRADEEPLVEAISETLKHYVFTKESLGDTAPLFFHYYMRDYIMREYSRDPDVHWKKIAEILLYSSDAIYTMDSSVNLEQALQEAFAKSQHSSMEIGKASRLIRIIKEAREDAIKKMSRVAERSSKLKRQIVEGDFMATYELVMNAIAKSKKDERFVPLLQSLRLPGNDPIQEHILYIFGIRQVERQALLKGELAKRTRNEILRDNLNTVSFFKLAELIVEQTFYKVRQARLEAYAQRPDTQDEQIRDMKNSEYMLIELISRIIYKYVSESPKRREEYYGALKYYYEDHPFFVELQRHIADELRRKSFQTEEHWKALGASPTVGHVGLIEKCIIPPAKVNYCVMNCEKYGDDMNDVMTIIENNLSLERMCTTFAASAGPTTYCLI
jgi:diadenosine tetraphosphate (Ap4A) HIT family hydrolase